MKLVVQIRSHAIRRWHEALLSRLAARPDTIVAVDHRACQATPRGVDALMQLEAVLHRVPRPGLATPAAADALAQFQTDTGDADLILALDAAPEGPAGTPAWQLAFDDGLGEAALLCALMARRPPLVTLVDRAGATIAGGRPGSEAGGVLLQAVEDTLARVTTLILAALDGAAIAPPHRETQDTSPSQPRPIAVAAGKTLVNAVIRRIYTLCYNAPHWRVGWRTAPGADLPRDLSTEGAPWTVLPDDGRRFYADPFAITLDGVTTLFVEEFPHATAKGIISAVALGPDGPIGPPRPVLETGVHLSYPHVFLHDGAIWMVPESSGARSIDLYRATEFPGGWIKDATLVDDVVASDATLVRHGARWWMFATVRDEGGAFSDALHLWSSQQLQGPWHAHPRNPVLVDIASARPAGAFIVQGDTLLRPVQDCRRGYGAALGLARITRLDETGFAQDMRSVAQGEGWRGRLHTYNRCGRFELIDGSARVLKRIGSRA